MTEQEQRIAIAEACDRRVCKHHPDKWERRGPEGDSELYCAECKKYLSDMRVPDYLHDLNAMAEAEKLLMGTPRWLVYLGLLEDECGDHAVSADSSQRAETFLRTIGKWKD